MLAGYTSALLLVLVAGLMLFQSLERLLAPQPIHYDQAIALSIVGLLVNLACAWLLRGGHRHGGNHHVHGQGHAGHNHHARDHSHARNMRMKT